MTAAAYNVRPHKYDALDLAEDAHLLDLRNRAFPLNYVLTDVVPASTDAPVVPTEGTCIVSAYICAYCHVYMQHVAWEWIEAHRAAHRAADDLDRRQSE